MKSDLIFISSKEGLEKNRLQDMKKKVIICLYCQDNIKCNLLSDSKSYYYCENCKCHYIVQKDILVKLTLSTKINDKHYGVELDLVKNKTNLVNNVIIYSYDECLAISPQNIKSKVQTWLLMQ